ncbi:Endonuclease/exonuclease/phosphatase [Russula compacta]|nr:Endonuclease/exonuclease/phosphatase [Russula compacta]
MTTTTTSASKSSSDSHQDGTPLRLATWNVRYDVQPDWIPVAASLAALPDPLVAPPRVFRGEQPWSARRVRVAQRLLASHVDLVGSQEVLLRQVRDLEELLGGDFAWIGVGREDGVAAGEFCPVFYRRTAFTLLQSDTFWLSHTPFKPGSFFPGAGCPRLATFTLFRSSPSLGGQPRDFVLINTHLDHASDAQRKFGAAMLLHRARYEAHIRPGLPVLLTGDLNRFISSPSSILLSSSSPPEFFIRSLPRVSASGSDSGAYAVLTGTAPAPAVPDDFARRFPLPSSSASAASSSEELVMRDLRGAARRAFVGGQWATFTGFHHRKDEEMCIDFVFGASNGGWEAKGVFVETALSDDGMLASDHRPVVADIVIT